MGYRRLFIIRKDLHLSPGKLSAMLMHCVEAYYTSKIRENICTVEINPHAFDSVTRKTGSYFTHYRSLLYIPKEEYEEYINGSFVKTVCQARNKNHLLKAADVAAELGLYENVDYGIIRDKCLTELEPEEDDGTTIVGVWFKPLPDEIAHAISKKYHLYI